MDICEYFVRNFQNLSSEAAPWMYRMSSSFSNFNKRSYGNSYDFGDFDNCLDTKINNSPVVGKYCLVKYTSDDVILIPPKKNPYNPDWTSPATSFGGAVCIPNVCSNDIIKNITDKLFDGTNMRLSTDYNQNEFCQIKESGIKFGYYEYFIISFITLYLLFIIMASWKTRNKNVKTESYLSAFSFTRNIESLFETRNSSFNSSFQFMSVLRAALYLAVIFFHSYFNRAHFPSANSKTIVEFMKTSFSRFLLLFPHGLLAFFIVSSALTTKKILSLLDKKSFNFCKILAERYCRIMFIVVFLIIGNIFINNMHIFQTPFYYPDVQSIGCKENWWKTLLLINNFHAGDDKYLCIPQSWFLCVNFHLFVLTPLIIYPIWKWKLLIWIIFPLLIVTEQFISFFFVFHMREHLNQINFFSISDGYYTIYHAQTIFFVSPWTIGMILGLIFHKYKKINFNMISFVLIGSFLFLMFIKKFIWDIFFGPPEFNFILFATDRLITSISIGCVLFLTNYLRLFNKKENFHRSAKEVTINPFHALLIMIDRIGLSLYLINVPIVMMNLFLRKQALIFDTSSVYIESFSDMLISIIAAIFMFVLVEEPFSKITRKILNGSASKTAPSKKCTAQRNQNFYLTIAQDDKNMALKM